MKQLKHIQVKQACIIQIPVELKLSILLMILQTKQFLFQCKCLQVILNEETVWIKMIESYKIETNNAIDCEKVDQRWCYH